MPVESKNVRLLDLPTAEEWERRLDASGEEELLNAIYLAKCNWDKDPSFALSDDEVARIVALTGIAPKYADEEEST